jgi:hypothetical protein
MDGVLTPLLAGLAVLVFLVAIGYTLVTLREIVTLTSRRLARRWRSRGVDADAAQEWLYRERRSETRAGVDSGARPVEGAAARSASAERAAAEITEKARQEAERLLRQAELRAREIVAEAERESRLLRQQLAEERRQLSSLLHEVLEEVRHGSGEEIGEVRDLARIRELRDRSEASE